MDPRKRQDQFMLDLITTLLRDVQTLHSGVISPESLRIDTAKVVNRFEMEGNSFLTKQLPRLGKAFDSALSGKTRLDAAEVGFKPGNGCLPLLLGKLFDRVFSNDGRVLSEPCVSSIRSLRQVLYSFYKYELPYDVETESAVLSKFVRTEEEVVPMSRNLQKYADYLDAGCPDFRWNNSHPYPLQLFTRARLLLWRLFAKFDIHNIVPAHGPGAVSGKERVWNKWQFRYVSPRIAETYPIDQYYFASLSHVADRLQNLQAIKLEERSARVVLVPKDSRGPRVISCEPLEFQWIQQGLRAALYEHIERHPLTTDNVHFTNQVPNQKGALLGSSTGKYATLDLAEASDRISVGLVNVLFSEPLKQALLNCRSLSTVMPDGRILMLQKYAPMGSALCFPVLATSIWALLTAAAVDADPSGERDLAGRILVYGDDVVVPTEYAENAIKVLSLVGLKVNQDKSYTTGLFRESCGVDAYMGEDVTPVRFKTVWSSHRCPEVLTAWCEYANAFYENSFFNTYERIVRGLLDVYHTIPERRLQLGCPSLYEVPPTHWPKSRYKSNGENDYQKLEYLCWVSRSRHITHESDGWLMLHRYLATAALKIADRVVDDFGIARPTMIRVPDADIRDGRSVSWDREDPLGPYEPFRVRSYTRPRANKLARRWHLAR